MFKLISKLIKRTKSYKDFVAHQKELQRIGQDKMVELAIQVSLEMERRQKKS